MGVSINTRKIVGLKANTTAFGPVGFKNLHSIIFDGTDEYLTSTTSPVFGTANWSVNYWIYRTSTSGSQRLMSKSGGSDAAWEIVVTNGGVMQFISSPWNDGDGTNSPGTSVWEMWTYSVDRSGLAIWYKNGANPNQKTISAISGDFGGGTSTLFEFGKNGSSYNFAGNLDEISMWNKALSSSEITALYNSGVPTDLLSSAPASNLINWFRMGDPGGTGSYPTISDAKGSIAMTMTNMASSNITTNVPS